MSESPGSRNLPTVEFSADQDRLDHARVHALLAEYAYWAQGRTREEQDRVIAQSRNYGMYLSESGEQVAYARVATDMVTFAWLADVIVDPAFGRRGIGSALIE
jgi:predicted GNAT family acetyltransferase